MGNANDDSRDSTRELSFPTGDGRVIIVRVHYAANTVIVVPVPPRPNGPDYSYMLRGVDRDHSISVEINIEQRGA